MHNKHPILTLAYHYYSEAIIIFIISFPYFYFYLFTIPFWSYLTIAFGLSIVFSFYSKFTLGYKWYFLMAPFLLALFYLLNYPGLINMFYTFILIWRYLMLKQKKLVNRERSYLVITTTLASIFFILSHDYRLFVCLLLQFFILIVGNIFSHFTILTNEKNKRSQLKLLFYYFSFLFLGGIITYFILFILKKAWKMLILMLSFDPSLLKFLDFEFKFKEAEVEPDFLDENILSESELGNSIFGFINESVANFIGITFLILLGLAVIVFVFIKLKNELKPILSEDSIEISSNARINEKISPKMNLGRLFKRNTPKLEHPVRKLMYHFEKEAVKKKMGRKHFETLEDWFTRMGIKINVQTYQEVRYGQANVTDEEVNELKEQLNKIKAQLKEK